MWFTSFFEGTVPRYATFYTEGFSRFVTAAAASIATG
jgi:hypothetical protein